MDELDRAVALYEADQLSLDLLASLRAIRDLHGSEERGEDIQLVWKTVRLVAASALVEHLRLLGMDVAEREVELEQHGSAPWRDLIAVSSDGVTDGLPMPEATDDCAPIMVEPQLHLSWRPDGRWFLSAPITVDDIDLLREGV